MHALHQYPNGSAPDPISATAIAAHQQEQSLLQSYKDWQAGNKSVNAAYQAFATNCHCLWLQYKSQGSRNGKAGFKKVLRGLGIPERSAYKALWAAFPSERPTSRQNVAKLLPLPRLDLKQLKSLAGAGNDFQSELSLGLTAIANAVAERYGVNGLFTVTLQQLP